MQERKIIKLTKDYEPIISFYELSEDQKNEELDIRGDYAIESSYVISDNNEVFCLADFIRARGDYFDGFADYCNVASYAIKINQSDYSAMIYIVG